MNRTDRLVSMVMFLQGRRLVRAEDLAAHFEVSERTVYRDIAALAESGVPVCGEAGVGYSLVKGYHLPPVSFTAEEAMALFMAGELLKRYSDESMRGPAESAMLKIRSVLPRDRQDEMERRAAVMLIGGLFRPDKNQRTLLPIKKALIDRKVLRMSYRAGQKADASERDVEPLGLIFGGNLWYLVAWCRLRKDLRHFRLDRILALELLDETFEVRGGFSLKQHLEESSARSVTQEVRLRVKKDALDRVRKESYSAITEHKCDSESCEITLQTYSIEWMARWILSFGPDVEALAPSQLRERIRIMVSDIADRYGPRISNEKREEPL